MAVVSSDSTQLDCGRELDEVWAHADAPPDEHEVGCPECQAARASYAELNAATRQLRVDDENNDDLRLNADLMGRIMTIARAEARRGQTFPLRPPAPGRDAPDLAVTEQAVATVVRRVGDLLPGVEVRRCRVRLLAPTGTGSADAVPIGVALTVAVESGVSIPDCLARLRRDITATIAAEVGLVAAVVDVHVQDILDAGGDD